MKQNVNERVRLLRSSLRMTQAEFASELKVSSSLISKIEQGIEDVSATTLEAIISKFSVPEDWLINGNGTMKFVKPILNQNDPWQDALYRELKERIEKQDSTIDRLTSILSRANFRTAHDLSGLRKRRASSSLKEF